MCNGYDLLDDMKVGKMFDVLMDKATMEQDFIKTFILLKMFIICRYEWNIVQTYSIVKGLNETELTAQWSKVFSIKQHFGFQRKK